MPKRAQNGRAHYHLAILNQSSESHAKSHGTCCWFFFFFFSFSFPADQTACNSQRRPDSIAMLQFAAYYVPYRTQCCHVALSPASLQQGGQGEDNRRQVTFSRPVNYLEGPLPNTLGPLTSR